MKKRSLILGMFAVVTLIATSGATPVRAQEQTGLFASPGDIQSAIVSGLKSLLPVVMFNDQVILSEPAPGTAVLVGKQVTVDAPVGKDLFTANFDLVVNATVAGKVNAVSTQVTLNQPTMGVFYSPTSLLRMAYEQFLAPKASDSAEMTATASGMLGTDIGDGQNVDAATAAVKDVVVTAVTDNVATDSNLMVAGEAVKNSSDGASFSTWLQSQLQDAKNQVLQSLGGTLQADLKKLEDSNVQPDQSSLLETIKVPRIALVSQAYAQEEQGSDEPTADATENSSNSADVESDLAKEWSVFVKPLTAFVGTLLSVWALVLIVPSFAAGTTLALRKSFLASLGFGFVGLFLIPLASLAVMLTVVGLPMSLVVTLLYLVGLLLSKWVVAIALGGVLGEKFAARRKHLWWSNPYVSSLLGVAILEGLHLIPGLGWLVTALTILFGFGACMVWLLSGAGKKLS